MSVDDIFAEHQRRVDALFEQTRKNVHNGIDRVFAKVGIIFASIMLAASLVLVAIGVRGWWLGVAASSVMLFVDVRRYRRAVAAEGPDAR